MRFGFCAYCPTPKLVHRLQTHWTTRVGQIVHLSHEMLLPVIIFLTWHGTFVLDYGRFVTLASDSKSTRQLSSDFNFTSDVTSGGKAFRDTAGLIGFRVHREFLIFKLFVTASGAYGRVNFKSGARGCSLSGGQAPRGREFSFNQICQPENQGGDEDAK
jgi:hypothetical protein